MNNKAYKTLLNTISGTSSDPETSVTNVKVYVKRLVASPTWYYKDIDPEFSESAAISNNAAGVAPWTLELLESKLTDGVSYYLYTSARDESTNDELLDGAGPSTFIYDVKPPTSTVTNANVVAGYVNNLPTISGSANDVTPVSPAGAQKSDGISNLEIKILGNK